MNMFIFEPYQWDYCGGAIVVVAESEQRAHEFIWEYQKHEHELCYPNGKLIGAKHVDYSWEALKEDRMERFKQSENDENCWELTSSFKLSGQESYIERVVCFNYNYA